MTYLTGIVTVIHNASQVDFDNFVYSGVYCNVAQGPPGFRINGTDVVMVAGETLEILVEGPPATTLIYAPGDLLFVGNPMPIQTEFPTGKLEAGTATTNAVWQFVNIKNGDPTDG